MQPLNPASLDNNGFTNTDNGNNINNGNTNTSKKHFNKTIKNSKNVSNLSRDNNIIPSSSISSDSNQQELTSTASSTTLTKITGVDDVMKSIFNQNNESINSGTIFDIIPTETQKLSSQQQNSRKNLEQSHYSGEIQPSNNITSEYISQYADPNNTTALTQIPSTIATSQSAINTPINTNTELLQKLNYVIYLLEEQRSQKSNYVTEEIILYIFLGIFIIFVLDKFSRPVKYTR